MEQHDIEIEVCRNGEVKVHVRGARGEKCLSYVELMQQVVGPVRERRLTHEYYERDGHVRTDAAAEQRVHEVEG